MHHQCGRRGARQPQRHQHVDASRFSCVWSIKVVRAERNLLDPTGEKTHANKRSKQLIVSRAERQQNHKLKPDEKKTSHSLERYQIRFLQPNHQLPLLSLVSAFSQKNKTYKMGLRARARVCVSVCVSVQFWSPLTISIPVMRLIRNFGYIQYRTGTLQRH